MTLAEYLEKNGIRREDFANKIGVSQAYVSMLCHHKHDPSLAVIMRIDKATGGKVLAADLVSAKTAAALTPDAKGEERVSG